MPGLSVSHLAMQAGFALRRQACAAKGRMAVSAAFAPGQMAYFAEIRCRSSVVEHLIGNEEVHSSILCGSTISPDNFKRLAFSQ
jgi:hypothetical protein